MEEENFNNFFKDLVSIIWWKTKDDSINSFLEKWDKMNELWFKFLTKEKFDLDDFYFWNIYQYEQLLDWYIITTLNNWNESFRKNIDEIQFLIKNSKMIEHFLDNLFCKYEWNACSHDKTSFCMSRLLKFFFTGELINFDPYINEKWESYSYHIPKDILNTHDLIIEFFYAIQNIYYWNIEKYNSFLDKINSKIFNISLYIDQNIEEYLDALDFYTRHIEMQREWQIDAINLNLKLFNSIKESWIIKYNEVFLKIDIINFAKLYEFKDQIWLEKFLIENIWKEFKLIDLEREINKFK